MPITIGSNIGSLQAQRRLADATSSLSKTFERLASGQRINRASDDAAGLAVSQSLNLSGRVYGQAVRNINDGFSLLAIADEAINSLVDINTRLQELAQQAANGVYSTRQRQSLDNEAQTLAKEYFRISRATQFNGTRLFDGSLGDGLRFQLGFGVNGSIQTAMGGKLGTGSLSLTITMGAESGSSLATALGDINGDGILDMVTAGSDTGGAGYATIRLGQGDGTFGAATSYTTETGGSLAVSLSDLNGDGVLDLVTAGIGGGSGRVTVRLGTGTGTFGAATSYQADSTSNIAMSLGDLNGDGILDLVTAGTGGGGGRATVRLGNGNGTFGAASSISMHTTGATAVTLGDLNGDGILDLLTVGSDGGTQNATVRMGRGNGTFGASTSYATGDDSTWAVTIGDVNGDGTLDLVTSGYGIWMQGYVATAGVLTRVRFGNGNGSFGAQTSITGLGGSELRLADMNGDGHLDIVTGDFTNKVNVAFNSGSGGFSLGSVADTSISPSELAGLGSKPLNGIAIGDLNGDGVLDVLFAAQDYYNTGRSAVLLGNTRNGVSPIAPFSLRSRADALQAIGLFNRGARNLSDMRGILGASQSRLNTAMGVVLATRENVTAASSRITDADIAAESANLTRTQVLQKAGAAILAQANLQPQLALKLLS